MMVVVVGWGGESVGETRLFESVSLAFISEIQSSLSLGGKGGKMDG